MTAPPSFRVKICGVRKVSEVRTAAAAGADAVGLNFYPPSVRFLADPQQVADLVTAADQLGMLCIGVFVNEDESRMIEAVESRGVGAVQLHGDESLAVAQRLVARGIPVIRAVRLPGQGLEPDEVERRVRPWREAGCGVLLDADVGSRYGGEGHRLDWRQIGRWNRSGTSRWMLAGGLNVQRVGEAIQESGAWGVDVASGVERPRGQKDPRLITRFTSAAISALEATEAGHHDSNPDSGRQENTR
ncbi:phosphoribosylanthranilate isomerase [Roseimaritima sediminicola]|uniref:phosphoribosylanthranilate isomerase n=1 Tax=Roseimaritima sediminicola TaxID=2662066 RepID=UPI00129851DD|nr:phosphoribosylanthranilate isomerase [Roseimaritima sediminicola]